MANATQIKVVLRDGENFEQMMRRFKKAYQESGVLAEVRKHEFYQSKSEKRRIKHENALKERNKEERKGGYVSE